MDLDSDLQRYPAKNRNDSLRCAGQATASLIHSGEGLDHVARQSRLLQTRTMPATHVVIIGGGLAGLAAAVALAEEKFRITLFERHPRLGGRATTYALSNGESIDNCQHVTLRCCTNLEDFYRRLGVEKAIHYYNRLTFTDSKGGRGEIRPWALPAPFHLLPSFAVYPLLNWKDKRA